MNIIKRALWRWLSKDRGNLLSGGVSQVEAINSSSNSSNIQKSGLRFCLYGAVGGHILECSSYNTHKGHEGTLYMIKEEEDFARQVANAIMIETLKQ